MKKYPEIEALRSYFEKFKIKITKSNGSISDEFIQIKLTIDSHSWQIFIDDEYRDFAEDNPLICFFLVLNSLEIYSESGDFLAWSKEHNLKPSDKNWLEYYKSLETIYLEIERKIGKIDSFISPYNYSLRTGIIKALLNRLVTL